MRYNPYEVLLSADDSNWPENVDVYDDAIDRFDINNPEPLVELLQSNDPIVSGRGLFVFGELGKKAFPLVDLAIRLNTHPHIMARNGLMDGIICYSAKLSPEQSQKILMLADDSHDVTRGKVIAFIGASKPDNILKAINLIEERGVRLKHLTAFEAATSNLKSVQAIFDEGLKSRSTQSTYLLAMLQGAARRKEISSAPIYKGDDYIGESVSANIRRIIRLNSKRMTEKGPN